MLRTIISLALAVLATTFAVPADAAVRTHFIAHFDITAHQQPENITLEPDGSADLTFNGAAQVARVHPDGRTEIIAQLPAGGGVAGIVRVPGGTLYVNFRGGAQTGVWRIRPGRAPELFAALPTAKFPNGLALGRGALYVTDSAVGAVWRVPLNGGAPALWASGGNLTPVSAFGSNGVKVRGSAVWVSNTDRGLLLRIPIRRDGSAGAIETSTTGLAGIDDFIFAGDKVLAAINRASEVVAVRPGGMPRVLLTQQDGLSNPTSIAVRGNTFYVASAAYATMRDPNLLRARLR